MTPTLSVLVCSHNPREQFLRRTLSALAAQTLPLERWELLLIDNRSNPPIAPQHDLRWHPNGRHLVAEKIGKTHAIAEGVRNAKGSVLIVVDDDNVLNADYLEIADRYFREHAFFGAAGGIIDGEYQTVPPIWSVPYLPYLAIENRGEELRYVYTPDAQLVCPGAGMVIRKNVVEHYLEAVAGDPVRTGLDPVGDRLSRAGDSDMMLCAYEIGLAKAYIPALRVTHLIPSERLTLNYLARLREEGEHCGILLLLIRGLPLPASVGPLIRSCLRTLRDSIAARQVLWQRFWLEWSAWRGRQRAVRGFGSVR